jgi:excisionase family DNA binding protein
LTAEKATMRNGVMGRRGRGHAARLVLSIEEAAGALSISRDSFERHVMAELRLVRIGRRLLVPVDELERWIEREMAMPLVAELSTRASERPLVEADGAE